MSRILQGECFDHRYLKEEIKNAFLRFLKQGYNKGFDEREFQGFHRDQKQEHNDGFDDGESREY
jgi:hypothetical protein